MNLVALGFGFLGGTVKKQIAFVLATMLLVLALPFIAVLSMGSNVLQFLAHTPSASAASSLGFYMGGPVPNDTYEWGNCTYWVFAMRQWAGHPIGGYWGNANKWDEVAASEGYIVDHIPTPGSIYQTDAGQMGHVAYVTAVDAVSGQWTISEMNAVNLNVVDTRTFPAASAIFYDFIHDKKGVEPWIALPISNPSLPTGN